MAIRPVTLDCVDAVECGELLEFIGRWLACDGDFLAGSLGRFVGGVGYDIDELRADLSRFVTLLSACDEVIGGGR